MHSNQAPTTSSTSMDNAPSSSVEVDDVVVQPEGSDAGKSPILVIGEASTNNLELLDANQPQQENAESEASGNNSYNRN